MITLANPVVLTRAFGGLPQNAYDRVSLDNLTYSPAKQSIVGDVIVSASDDSHPTVKGRFEIIGSSVNIIVPELEINQAGSLTPEQLVVVQSYIDTARSQIESGLVAIGMIAGSAQ
jgi:hypothetical protein